MKSAFHWFLSAMDEPCSFAVRGVDKETVEGFSTDCSDKHHSAQIASFVQRRALQVEHDPHHHEEKWFCL